MRVYFQSLEGQKGNSGQYPIVWSIIGASLFIAGIGLFRRGRI